MYSLLFENWHEMIFKRVKCYLNSNMLERIWNNFVVNKQDFVKNNNMPFIVCLLFIHAFAVSKELFRHN